MKSLSTSTPRAAMKTGDVRMRARCIRTLKYDSCSDRLYPLVGVMLQGSNLMRTRRTAAGVFRIRPPLTSSPYPESDLLDPPSFKIFIAIDEADPQVSHSPSRILT